LREQAILTIKVILIAGGALGVLTLLDQMVGQ
jgi:UDP-N-acetylglucosamine:LPS N-acetylglucosamine transferase